MKRILSVAVVAVLVSSGFAMAAPKDDIEAKEKAAWQAFKDKKPDDFKKVVDHDVVAVYPDGIMGMSDELSDMQKWDMKSYSISDFKSTSDEKDVIVVSYKVTLQGTVDGKDMSGTYNAGTVWKIENGQWLAIFHTNVKEEAATK